MNEYVVKASWILAAIFVVGGLLRGFVGVDIVGVAYTINYFHAANTALLFGILFSLRKQK